MLAQSICEYLYDEDIGIFQTYGLIVYNEKGTSQIFHDITCNKNSIDRLIRRLSNADISDIHIKDIIEDFISEESILYIIN